MVRKFARLQRIDNDGKIEMGSAFSCHLRYGLLIALVENGTLNTSQFRLAEQRLRDDADRKTDRGDGL